MSFELYDPEHPAPIAKYQARPALNDPALYRPSPALADAVNVALNTGLPLLLTGEPGTGKTQLAYHLAHHFGLGQPMVYNVRTTSTATDLFYRYDAVRHFHHVQNKGKELADAEIEERFIRYNALGEAIRSGERCVVLLDEIDKAPRDLPNDILFAIEKLQFEVPEINRMGPNRIKSSIENRPFIILTSNSEKTLPDAFLRRCVYFHIPFPDTEELVNILQPKISGFNEEQMMILAQHFQKIRDLAKNKKPATAELIFWTLLLEKLEFPIEKLHEGGFTDEEKEKLLASYSLLLKNQADLEAIRAQPLK